MQNKLKFVIQIAAAAIIISSCSKGKTYPEPPVPPPPAPLYDTLGTGWQKIAGDTSKFYSDVFFVNNQTGFLCATNYLAKSTDGGLTWQKALPDSLNDNFINIFFVDANNGWVTASNSLLRTKDGGTTWQRIQKRFVFDVQFFDANHGYITADTTALYRTSDGGVTFDSVSKSDFGRSLYFFSQNKGWATGAYFYRTDNAGQSFTRLLLGGIYLYASDYIVQFTDSLHGWITGGNLLRRTLDGGNTVEILISDTKGGGDVHFFDNNNGYIMAGDALYSTADGGATRNKLCSIHKCTLSEMHFTDANHGWAVGSAGGLYRYVKL